MGELILHIGTTKTGTSSLQSFFFESRELLKEHGVYFPVFTRQTVTPYTRNGLFLCRHCRNLAQGIDPSKDVDSLEKNLKQLSESLSSHDRVLLSEECFFLFSSRLLEDTQSTKAYWPIVARLLDEAGADEITIVTYLRRQDDWIASQWRQQVRKGYQDEALADYCNGRSLRLAASYANILAAADRAFDGAARIVARRYDRGPFEGGDIFRDFCAACGIPWDEDYVFPENEWNRSLSFDVAEALRTFKGEAPADTPLREANIRPSRTAR